MITIDIGGIERLNRNIDTLRPLFAQAARETVVDTLGFAEVAIADHIDRYDAIDEGRLKGSVTQKDEIGRDGKSYTFDPKDTAASITTRTGGRGGGVSSVEGVVGTNVHYAIPVHEGSTTSTGRHIDGRPFMADAVPEIEAHFEQTAQNTFGSLLR